MEIARTICWWQHHGDVRRRRVSRTGLSILTCLVAVVLLGLSNVVVHAQNLGPTSAGINQLQRRFTAEWKLDLAGVTRSLAAKSTLPIFIDRRVDPGQFIELKVEDKSIGEIIYLVAEQANCQVAWVGDVAYLAPVGVSAQLTLLRARLLEEIGKLPASVKRKLKTRSAWSIPGFAEPNLLLVDQLERMGMKVSDFQTGTDLLPHDLMRESDFQSITPIDRLVLLTFGFGLLPAPGREPAKPIVGFSPVEGLESGRIVVPVPKQSGAAARRALAGQSYVRFQGSRAIIQGTPDQVSSAEKQIRLAVFNGRR